MNRNIYWMVGMAMASLTWVGCIDGNSGGDNSDVCSDGESCDFKCQGGSCDLECEEGSNCEGRCDGGQCDFDCNSGATCDFNCVGGECNFDCAPGSTCELTCAGGECNFDDKSGNDPNPEPSPNPEPEPEPDPEPEAARVTTCADLCTFTDTASDPEIACVTTFMERNGYNVTSSQTCLGIKVEFQCNACAGQFDIEDADCASAFDECF